MLPHHPAVPLLSEFTEESETGSYEDIYTRVQNGIILSCQNMEVTCVHQ